jgi:hypothetical protein
MKIPVQSRRNQREDRVNIFDTESGCSTLNNIPFIIKGATSRKEITYAGEN